MTDQELLNRVADICAHIINSRNDKETVVELLYELQDVYELLLP